MTTVLVPVGHPIEASRATERLSRLTSDPGALRVVVLHVHEVCEQPGHRVTIQQEGDDDCLADVVARTLRRAGLAATARTVTSPWGSLGETIAAIAEEEDAEMVLVGDDQDWFSRHEGVRDRLERLLPPSRRVLGVS